MSEDQQRRAPVGGSKQKGAMKVEPLTLRGRFVQLEPLALRHAADLAHTGSPELFRYMSHSPASLDEAGLARYIAEATASPERIAFAIVDLARDQAVGTSSYFDIRAAHRGLEIGHTWIALSAQGTRVNPEAKLLLLEHAFERLGCIRVQLKTDSRNEQSQRAMLKLGCVREGILRKHMVMPDGHLRDTVLFSITNEEWPAVRSRLEARLNVAGN